jgi:hypothetical protein
MTTSLNTNHVSQTKAENLSKTEQLMVDIRKTALFRQLIPLEAGIGWPIPLRKEGEVYLILPFFGFAPDPQKGSSELFPPFATLSWKNGTPVEYVNLRFRNPAPELNWEGQAVGKFPHASVQQLTIAQYKEKRRRLLSMYDELFEMLATASSLSQEWNEEFENLLRTLMEPSLEPYYRVLGSKFFDRFLGTK